MPDLPPARKFGAAAALLLMFAGGFELFYLRIWRMDRAAFRTHLRELPYRKVSGYSDLLRLARTHTRNGDVIALWLHQSSWTTGYKYAFDRAAYMLAGRRVLPLLDSGNRFLEQNLKDANVVICWRCEPPPEFERVAASPSGVVARRR